ncbi:MAG: hypothetical protein FWG40_09610, partial [Peptococcaceae bacterium]|nr:hypothetical protein [Peptococcaceae bacterium]
MDSSIGKSGADRWTVVAERILCLLSIFHGGLSNFSGGNYIISGWAWADAVKRDDTRFDILATVTYASGATKDRRRAAFNPCITGWQYTSGVFTLGTGNTTADLPVKITVRLRWNKQANPAYFDNIQLIKDNAPTTLASTFSRKQDYTYDNLNRLTDIDTTTDAPVNTHYKYKLSDRNAPNQSQYRTTLVSTEFIGLRAYSYTFDVLGNITKITEGTRANQQETTGSGY